MKKYFNKIITFPILFLTILIGAYLIGTEVFKFSSEKIYIPVISNEEKFLDITEKVIDIKKYNFYIYILTKDRIVILNGNDFSKKLEIKFRDFGININPTAFGIGEKQDLYVVSDYKFIYKFEVKEKGEYGDAKSYKLYKTIVYPKGSKHYNPAIEKDGAGNNGYYCIIYDKEHHNFKHILDVSSRGFKDAYEYTPESLLILDTGYNKVLKCNSGFGPDYRYFKENIDIKIENPKYLLAGNYVYSDNEFQYIGDIEFSGNRIFKVDSNKGRLVEEDYIWSRMYNDNWDRYEKGTKKYFEKLENKFNKEANIVYFNRDFNDIYKRRLNSILGINKSEIKKDYTTLVAYKNEDGLYRVNFDIDVEKGIFYYIGLLFKYLIFIIPFYFFYVYTYLFKYFKENKTSFIALKYVFITTLIFAIWGFMALLIGCMGVSGEGGIGCFFMLIGLIGIGIINIIVSLVLGLIVKKKNSKSEILEEKKSVEL